jgi:hypothetical protein
VKLVLCGKHYEFGEFIHGPLRVSLSPASLSLSLSLGARIVAALAARRAFLTGHGAGTLIMR